MSRRFPLLPLLMLALVGPVRAERPNILLIMADDLGYGDVGAFNPDSKIPTPHLDRFASEGMRFTDAHAAGSTCVPSRYGLLTGCYPWRHSTKIGGLQGNAGSLINRDRPTIASMLKSAGYATGAIGKWHLGLGSPEEGTRFDKPILHGPNQLGFDYFFGLPASLDIPPYVYIRNDRVTEPLSREIAASETPGARWAAGAFWRSGQTTASFKHEDTLEVLAGEASAFLERHVNQEKPFFLYLPLTAPHTPWLPSPAFRGKSGAGVYGDFVTQVDAVIGEVLTLLDRKSASENTLVIFTSDNGAFWLPSEIKQYHHRANGPWRGQKGDIWEGGHRMPFIVRWPGKVAAGAESAQMLCFQDIFATLAELSEVDLPDNGAEDSLSFLSVLLGRSEHSQRDFLIHDTASGFAIRHDGWKFIDFLGSGGFTKPSVFPTTKGQTLNGQLYHLPEDPSENTNLFLRYPDRVASLRAMLDDAKSARKTR